MGKIETRTIAVTELRAGPAFEVAGRAASYNHLSKDLGGFVERLQPGCFTRSLQSGQDVKCLVNHDSNQILGRLANKTLTLSDSNEGLDFRCKLNPASQAHKDLYAAVKRQDLSECSFAFGVDDGGDDFDIIVDPDNAGRSIARRTIRSAKLFDCSIVASPAYGDGATSVSARSCDYSARYAPVFIPRTATLTEVRSKSKQTGRSFEQSYFELTGKQITVRCTPVRPLLSVDAENRRLVLAIGNRIAQEKRRDDLRRRLYPTPQELEQERLEQRCRVTLAKIKALGEEILGDEN